MNEPQEWYDKLNILRLIFEQGTDRQREFFFEEIRMDYCEFCGRKQEEFMCQCQNDD